MKFFITSLFLLSTYAQAASLKFMQYNVENFFDTQFDENTLDYTYLPLAVKKNLKGHEKYCRSLDTNGRKNECLKLDWNEAKFTKKIMNVARVIKAYDSTGNGPDIVVMEEVENLNVLNKLVTLGLDKAGYEHRVLIEGDDTRGIDVGLISKFPVVKAKRHPLVIDGETRDTRGILEVTLNVNGKTVVIFVNHWPSQNNPASERVASAKIIEDVSKTLKADLIIAAGDFNTVDHDHPYPFDSLVSFSDAEKEARGSSLVIHPGTHYYQGSWSSLDKIFIHSKSVLEPDFSKFQIFNHSFLMKKDSRSGHLVPFRFSHETGEGFSDHLPLGMEFFY